MPDFGIHFSRRREGGPRVQPGVTGGSGAGRWTPGRARGDGEWGWGGCGVRFGGFDRLSPGGVRDAGESGLRQAQLERRGVVEASCRT